MPLPPTIGSYNSDSEDEDVDYVPPKGESSDSEDSTYRRDQPSSIPEAALAEEPEEKKRKREALWAEFQASVAHPNPSESSATGVKMVKIEKRYRFAGDEDVVVVDVPEDSPEAKKWPLHRDPDAPSLSPATQATPSLAEQSATEQTSQLPNSCTMTSEDQPKTSLSAKPTAGKRPPGPRKSKITLASLPNSKAKKITTLEKSAMDWRAHVQAEEESGSSLKDELEVNRRTGGYLEKVEFLKRVEERREESLDAMKSNKRRKL